MTWITETGWSNPGGDTQGKFGLGCASESLQNLTLLDCETARIFAYSSTRDRHIKYIYKKKSTREQSNKRSGMRLKTESETGERRKKIGLTSPSGVWGSRASRDNLVPRALFPKPGKSALGTRLLARVRLLRHGYRFLYRFWEKNGLFCSLNPV